MVHLPKIDSCEICKTIVTLLDVFVDKNSTETEVKDALEKVCGLIKSSEVSRLEWVVMVLYIALCKILYC